jgi:hypothetical protein
MTSQKAWTKWRKLVSEYERSGQTSAVFCRERGLCRSYLFAWKKRLREAPPTKFVEVQLQEAVPSPIRDSRVEIRLQNGRSLLVGPGCDAQQVRVLVGVAETA